jgi:hypothetical protein
LRHPLAVLLLIVCLCWQSLAQAGTRVALAGDAERAHAVMHFHGEAHHHDTHDGGIHQDGSAASTQHLLDDACLYAPALVSASSVPQLPAAPADLPAGASPPTPAPFLEGLERPPRARA